jgi:hypothetical protein
MRITIALPNTHFERPTAEELRKLRKIVTAAHPWLNDCDEQSFSRAFTAIGFMFRTPQPVKSRYFHDILADANQLLDELLDLRLVDGIAFLAAALGHGDVKWQESNGRVGALLEIGLCPTHGIPCSTPNAWRGLLDGTRNLLAPVAPSPLRQPEPSPVRFLQNGRWQ